MSTDRIKVMVVDDQRLLRESLEQVLALESDLAVVPGAGNGQEAIEAVAERKPDVVLMDIRMPVTDGIAATRAIKDGLPSCRVVIMTVLSEQEYVRRAIIAGADGYLLKDATREQVADAVRRAHRGETVLEPTLLREVVRLYGQMTRNQEHSAGRPYDLTEREVEVLRLVAQGRANQEIADSLGVAVGTVKTHLHRAFEKIGVRDRTQAALFVIHHDL